MSYQNDGERQQMTGQSSWDMLERNHLLHLLHSLRHHDHHLHSHVDDTVTLQHGSGGDDDDEKDNQ